MIFFKYTYYNFFHFHSHSNYVKTQSFIYSFYDLLILKTQIFIEKKRYYMPEMTNIKLINSYAANTIIRHCIRGYNIFCNYSF
jgi:hypothetical protein